MGEFFAATFAFVWFFAGMDAHMFFQVVFEFEFFAAISKVALKSTKSEITKNISIEATQV